MNQDGLLSRSVTSETQPLASVVVPTFNRSQLLQETIESILSQTYTNFEVIVVDNMSVDDTESYVINCGDPRVRYFRNPNGGIISVNRNFGIKQSKGQFIALCDDDDIWFPTKLAKQMEVMTSDEKVGICYSNAESFSAAGTQKLFHVRRKIFSGHFGGLLFGNVIPNSSVLIRKKVLDDVGVINEVPELVGAEDYELWLRIAFRYEARYIDEALIRYRVHPGNLSGNMKMVAKRDFHVLKSIRHRLNIRWAVLIAPFLFKFARYAYYSITDITVNLLRSKKKGLGR
jgi:glycosyltransferase involved in cell wall biosynthesis